MRCKYPDCRHKATKTWALVPLCADHCETIKAETQLYYNKPGGRSEIEMRIHYLQISNLIPWSKERLGGIESISEEIRPEPKKDREIKRRECAFCRKLFMLEFAEEHEVGCRGGKF